MSIDVGAIDVGKCYKDKNGRVHKVLSLKPRIRYEWWDGSKWVGPSSKDPSTFASDMAGEVPCPA